jgi:uncharacterized protein YbjT (DUF2867 family)
VSLVRAVVLGASGVIGRALLPELATRYEVVAVSRRPQAEGPRVTWARADVTDRASVAALLREGDVVVYLVHSLGSSDFERVDRLAAENVASAAGQAGARQIVYLGGLGAEAGTDSKHLLSRAETAERLAAGPVPVTTLRAAMVVGPGSAAFETIRALVDRLPLMIAPRWVSTPTQPVALADVVRYLAGVCGLEAAYGESFDVGGPEVMTYREMIERIALLRGRRIPIVEVPVLTPRLSSWWLHLVTPVNAAVARPLIDGLRTPTVVRETRIRELVPFELTSFDDAVRHALAAGLPDRP